jgi:hypothetical protein
MSKIQQRNTFQPLGNTLLNVPQSYPVERGSMDYHHKYDFQRNMFGLPTDLVRNLTMPQYTQPMDMVARYKNRVLPIPSELTTTAMLNSMASFLLVASPIFLTPEQNFESTVDEINQIEFTPIAQAGIGHEQSSTEISWRSTTQKFTSSFPILRDLVLDENFGSREWARQLGGLASRAMLTIYKQVAYGILQMAFENKVSNNMKNVAIDTSKLYAAENESFLIGAQDMDAFFRLILKLDDTIEGMNMVIVRKGALQWLQELKGESTIMAVHRYSNDTKTGELLDDLDTENGPTTVTTVTYAGKPIQFCEMPNFKVNRQDDRFEQPLDTAVTLCQFYCPNADITSDVPVIQEADVNDITVYFQTKTTGDLKRISYVEALKNTFYWNTEDGGKTPSFYADRFVTELNNSHSIPKEQLDLEGTDNNNIIEVSDIQDLELTDATAWRDTPVGFTYDYFEGKWKIPKRVGDFHLRHLNNAWVHKFATALHEKMDKSCRAVSDTLEFDSMMDEFYDLMSAISSEPLTHEYLEAVVEANAKFTINPNTNVLNASKTKVRKEYPNTSVLHEWQPNEFGSLRLPQKGGTLTATYPWGFDSGPGLKTLAVEADKEDPDWPLASARAKKVVAFLEQLIKLIRIYIGNSDMINPAMTLPWFKEDLDLATLVDNLRPYKDPVFLALPIAVKATTTKVAKPFVLKSTYVFPKETKATYCLANEQFIRDAFSSFPSHIVRAENEVTIGTGSQSLVDTLIRIYVKLQDLILGTCKWNEKPDSPSTVAFVSIVTKDIADKTGAILTSKSSLEDQEKELKGVENKVHMLLHPSKSNTKESNLYYDALKVDELRGFKQLDQNDKLTNEKHTKCKEEREAFEKSQVSSNNVQKTLAERRQELIDAERVLSQAAAGQGNVKIADAQQNVKAAKKALYGKDIDATEGSTYNDTTTQKRYLRSPLMSSKSLLDYLQKVDGQPLALMSDPATNYETPLDNYANFNYDDYIEAKSGSYKLSSSFMPGSDNVYSLSSLSHSFAFQMKTPVNASSSNSYSEMDDDEVFSSLKHSRKSGSKSMGMDDYITGTSIKSGAYSLGRDYDIDRPPVRSEEKHSRQYPFWEKEKAKEKWFEEESSLGLEYFGPWEKRFNYMRDQIDSPSEKVLFKAILMARNCLSTFTNPSKMGQKLINVVIMRPFIEQIVSSAIVLQTGSSLTALGHASVWLSKEERGIDHTRCDFNCGIVKVNPFNYGMIYGAFPVAFIGGMKIDFIKHPGQFSMDNPEKPSCIAMLTPVTEYVYSYPIHPNNQSTYTRPDVAQDHFRKISFAKFFTSIFTLEVTLGVDGLHQDRKNYLTHVTVSFCGERGPMGFRNPFSPQYQMKFLNGSGARGDMSMNIGNAWKTHNGQAKHFPVVNTEYTVS